MTFLLDTNIVIHIGDQEITTSERLATLTEPKRLSVVTVAELEGGIAAVPEQGAVRRAILSEMMLTFGVIALDTEITRAYARILAATGFSRSRILDRLIAATAIVHDLTLITMNGPDFRDIPGLKLEVWPRPAQ